MRWGGPTDLEAVRGAWIKMVQTTPLRFLWNQTMPVVPALSSLTRANAAHVRAALASRSDYAVEEHDDYDGYLSLLLTPAQDCLPAYLLSGRLFAVDLAEIRDDEMRPMGTFDSVHAALDVALAAL